MTKTRRRTHKIHRKRGPRRGFKSRSQRGGWDWSDINPMNYFSEKKETLTTPLLNNYTNSSPQQPIASQAYQGQSEQTTYNPMQQTTYNPMQPPASMGGRKKCKRHHKHSRRCKK
jgi:hypothetical protein